MCLMDIEKYGQTIEKLEGIESFCYQNCLRIVLQLQGIKNSELYLNAAISFGFDQRRELLLTRQHIRSLIPQFSDLVKRKEYFDEQSAEKIFRENIEYIKKNNTAIIVGVDTYYLEYATNYLKNHARHTVVLCGYDSVNRKVKIIDWYPPWYFIGDISLEAFMNARASQNESDGTIYSGKPINNNWAKVELIPQKSEKELLMGLLADMVLKLNSDENSKEIVYGIDAMKEFGRFIEKTSDSKKLQDTYKKLIVITKRYNFFRMYMSHFDNIDIVRNIILNLDYQIDEWDRVSMLILKASISYSSKIKDKINIRLNNLIENEKELNCNIMQLYNKLKSEV